MVVTNVILIMKTTIRRTFLILLLVVAIFVTTAAVVVLPDKRLTGVPMYQGLPAESLPSLGAEENLTGVPLHAQPNDETCGEAAFLMAWDYVHPTQTLNLDTVIAMAIQQGWYIPYDQAGVYTSPDHMRDMTSYYATQHSAPSPEVGQVTTPQHGLLFLYSQIVMGHPVVVDVNTIIGDTESAAHFVVVTGVSLIDAKIYYNDPYGYISATEHQAGQRSADWATFWDSWSNNGDDNGKGNGWYMIIN